jgi:hypothetical protein
MPFKKPHQTAENNPVNIKQIFNGWEIMPKGLNIIWGNDLRYWKTITNEGGAELIQVSWLEVSGKVGPVHVGETYVVKFHIEVKDTGFGWTGTEVLVMAKIGKKGPYKYKSVKLACGDKDRIPKEDGELKITVGSNQGEPEKDPDLHFGLYEVWSGKWKGGLIIKKAEIIKT